jgi:hypothetical protein
VLVVADDEAGRGDVQVVDVCQRLVGMDVMGPMINHGVWKTGEPLAQEVDGTYAQSE